MLFTLVWALSVSGLTAYFYLQNTEYDRRIAENQQTLDEIASAYNGLMTKYNELGSEYSMLYGSYSFPFGVNFTLLMEPLGRLTDNLKLNYSSILMDQKDLNETYYILQEDYQKVYQKGSNITREDFGGLLEEFHEIYNLLTLRELSIAVSETIKLTVSIGIDYGNGTLRWHNETEVPAGFTLFQLTQEIAKINYTYYQFAKPGHILVDSINDKEAYTAADFSEGWSWIWYYWDDDEKDWVSGLTGCDAWMLEEGGIYRWKFEHWTWP